MTVIGTVNNRSFDQGVVDLLSPTLLPFTIDGTACQKYALAVPGVDAGFARYALTPTSPLAWLAGYGAHVPVYYHNPEDVYQPALIPCIRISQPGMEPAADRQPWYGLVGRKPAVDAAEVILPSGERGYTKYESQWKAEPYNLTYDLTILGRRREDANLIRHYVLRKCRVPGFNIPVVDTLGEDRLYDAVDVSISDVSEIAEIADRVIGWTISFTVRAEIDVDDPMIGTAFTGASALDPTDPLYSRFDLNLRLHLGIDPTEW